MNQLYPIFINLGGSTAGIEGKPCLVVGGGEVAYRKIQSLLDADAKITVISPRFIKKIQNLGKTGKIELIKRQYLIGDAEESYFLVIGATDNPVINQIVFQDAKKFGILTNIVDQPELSNFHSPAVFVSGDLKIAISTNGKCPALARKIRQKLEAEFGEAYAIFLEDMSRVREVLKKKFPDSPRRREELMNELINGSLLDLLLAGHQKEYKAELTRWI